jgi:multidrug efflux pump subunit AcrB
MKLSKLAIENHQFTIIIITIFLLAGIISLINMPRSEDPLVSPAGSSVIVIYPGANPADMEELVVDPIETAINELEDIKHLTSTAEDGLAVIGVEFEAGSDPDEKYSDVVQKVNSVQNELPADILDLSVNKWSITDVNIIQVGLVSSTSDYRELEKEAERLKRSFEKVPGVRRAETWAYPQQEVRVALDLAKIAKNHLSLQQVLGAIQNASQNIPGGNIDIGNKRFNIQTSGSYESIKDIENTVIHSANGKIVYLRDIAEVALDYEDEKYIGRFNGQPAVFVTANQKEGTNIFDVDKQLKEKISQFQTELPSYITLHIAFDQSKSVSKRVTGFFSNLLQGLILVGLVVFLVIGRQASLIVMFAIPVSILIAIGFIDLSNYGLQQMTIAGLVIALGLLVDNAIVVTENISRFIKQGYNNQDAAVKGTQQISWAVVSSTVTTVLAFIPMMMIGDVTGDFIRSMPVSVVYTLLASLFISLTLTPYLASKYLRQKAMAKEMYIRKAIDLIIEKYYRRRLAHALNHPKRYIFLALIIFLLSLTLFPLIGISFFPKAEKPQFIININTPDGTSIDRTIEVTNYVESVLSKQNNIVHYTTNIGKGNPRIYYNVIPENEKSNHAQILSELQEYSPDKFPETIEMLRKTFSQYAGAEIEVKEFEQGPPIEAPIAIRILGENLDILRQVAQDIESIISSTYGTINVKNPLSTTKTDLRVRINREKAALLGIPLVEIDRTIRAGIAGLPIAEYRDPDGKEYNIVVRLPIQKKPQLSDFDRIYVSSISGAQVPIRQVAIIEFKTSPLRINHYKMERNVTVTSDIIGNLSVDKITKQIIEKLEQYKWPKGYRYAIGGELESREESFGGMLQAVLMAMVAIFAVLVLQFRSHSQPFIVFSAIPLAIVGSIISLLITGYSFSFTAFVGLTSLVGIVVNNSIILVDYTNQLRAEGKDLISAIKEAGETRFVPIVLTTATTIGGLLPLTLQGGTLWAPMGWTIIGGLIASTLLTLLIVPVLYKLFTRVA